MKIALISSLVLIVIIFSGFFLFEQKLGGLTALIGGDTRLPYPSYNLEAPITNYNQINLSWTEDPVNDVSSIPITKYKIFRRPAYGSWIFLAESQAVSYTDNNVPPGSYDYRVDTCNDNGCSESPNPVFVSFAKDTTIPSRPENFSVPQQEVTDAESNLSWSSSTDDIGIEHYNIYRSIASATNFKFIASTSATTYEDSNLSPLTNYYYKVRSVDYAGNESEDSNLSNIITKSLANDEYIRVVSPNGGECFTLPGNLHITWTGNNFNRSALYYGGEKIYLGNATMLDWYMTASVSPTTAGSIKAVVVDLNGNEGVSDTNDNPFVISLDCSKENLQKIITPEIPTFFKGNLVYNKRDIYLNWQDNSKNETEFRVFRKKLPEGSWQLVGKTTADVTNFTDREVPPADYVYDVNACNNSGCSAYSNTFKITAIATIDAPNKIYTASELRQGDLVSAANSNDPDIYIVNEHGFKRLFLNPAIFSFYGHLGGFEKVKNVESTTRDIYGTSGLFSNCEVNDGKVYGVEITGEDSGTLHWVNTTGEKAVADDPDFFKKVFCINNNEFNWYNKGSEYNSINQIPKYDR